MKLAATPMWCISPIRKVSAESVGGTDLTAAEQIAADRIANGERKTLSLLALLFPPGYHLQGVAQRRDKFFRKSETPSQFRIIVAIPILIVGGVKPDNMRPWLDAGASGFGLGGGLYQPGQSPGDTLAKARAYVAGLKG